MPSCSASSWSRAWGCWRRWKVSTIYPSCRGRFRAEGWLASKELGADADIPNHFLFPPQIAGVFDGVTDDLILSARAGDRIVVRGSFFGKKPPKAWLEYPSGGAIKMLKLKVVKPLAYADISGKPDKSAMQAASGASRVVYQIPDKLPAGWVHGGAAGGTHHLVLDNGVGLAVIDFDTRP